MATSNTTPGQGDPVVDNPDAPDVLSSGIRGVFLLGQNVHITLASKRADYSIAPTRFYDYVIGRVVMPIEAAEKLAIELLKFIAQMKAQANAPADVPRTLQ